MTAAVGTTNTESDPVATALADPVVGGRLLAAARAFLGRRAYALTATQRLAEAEEIVSVARENAWKTRDTFDGVRDVVKWLIGFVNNATRDHLKRRQREQRCSTNAAPELESVIDDIGAPIDALLREEQRERITRLLAQLSAEDQAFIRLKYDERLTFEEIGERVGAKTSAVRTRHFRLLARLREMLEASGEGQP